MHQILTVGALLKISVTCKAPLRRLAAKGNSRHKNATYIKGKIKVLVRTKDSLIFPL
jgi:hypothetical protein